VLVGHCYEDALVPYQPLIEAIRGYVERCTLDELRLQTGSQTGELVALVPELRERLPHLRGAGEGERHLLFDAAGLLLREAAAARPVVLLLEDLHWADAPTLLLLKHIARFCRDVPLLILGTYRLHETDDEAPLARAIADLRREASVERIILGGLHKADVDELLQSWSGRQVPPEFVDAMVAETEGNPLFVRETLAHITERGILHRDGERWGMDRPLGEVGIPDGVREVIGRRLDRLDLGQRRVLGLAAVIGREFTLELTEIAGRFEDGEAIDALDDALSSGLVEEHAIPGHYRFSHGLIRETLYQSLSSARRAKLRRRVGGALEQLVAGGESHQDLLPYEEPCAMAPAAA
jgi:predicted ATPase